MPRQYLAMSTRMQYTTEGTHRLHIGIGLYYLKYSGFFKSKGYLNDSPFTFL